MMPLKESLVAAGLSDDEIEVVHILSMLPKYILAFDCRAAQLPPGLTCWGIRKRRSVPNDNAIPSPQLPTKPPSARPLRSTSLSPPIPSTPSSFVVEGKSKDEASYGGGSGSGGDGATRTWSPTTPLSFPVSCGDDNDVRPMPPGGGGAPPVPNFKNGKHHKQWVEQQQRQITLYSDNNAHLRREIEQYKVLLQSSMADSFVLQQAFNLHQERMRTALPASFVRLINHRNVNGQNLSVDSTSQPPAFVDQHHRDSGGQAKEGLRAVQPVSVVAREMLDLNVAPEEGATEMVSAVAEQQQLHEKAAKTVAEQQLLHEKAAKSAQARKRRLEKQREKNLFRSSSSYSSLLIHGSRNNKMRRLR